MTSTRRQDLGETFPRPATLENLPVWKVHHGSRLPSPLVLALATTFGLAGSLERGWSVHVLQLKVSALRADVRVAMSERLSLKVSLDLKYDNFPSLTAVPLESPEGEDTGETVRVELDELDSIVKAALVVNF